MHVVTNTPEETEKLAATIGARLRGGEVIELVSDLGGGKTTFTRGLASGAGSVDVVASPTFTVSKVYDAERLTIHHFDFYRLGDAGLIGYELADVMSDPLAVVVVEWGGVVSHVIPSQKLTVSIEKAGESSRKIIIDAPDELKYLVGGV